jgi:hypothetical protein
MDLGLMCPGCPAEAFHTLTDVAREYHLDPDQLLWRIVKVIKAKENGYTEYSLVFSPC